MSINANTLRKIIVKSSMNKFLGTMSSIVQHMGVDGMRLTTFYKFCKVNYDMPPDIAESAANCLVGMGVFEKVNGYIRFTKYPDDMPEGMRPPLPTPNAIAETQALIGLFESVAS